MISPLLGPMFPRFPPICGKAGRARSRQRASALNVRSSVERFMQAPPFFQTSTKVPESYTLPACSPLAGGRRIVSGLNNGASAYATFDSLKETSRRAMSHRIAAKITGVAGYVPPKVLTNADLEKMVETNDEWIRSRTGIRERRIAGAGTASSHLATEAAKTLLAQTKTDPTEIDLIIVASVTPDMFFPATACLVQDRLGAKRAWGFDLSAACSGFAYALTVGAQFVGSGAHRKVLVIGSD